MTSTHLLACYFAMGCACAFVIVQRGEGSRLERAASAAMAAFAWPLWAPIALAPKPPSGGAASHLRAAELHAALDAVVLAAAGSPFESLLAHDAVTRIRSEIDRAVTRIEELRATLEQPGFDPRAANLRLSELERANTSPRSIATARLHRDGVVRLACLYQKQSLAMEELGDALAALRAQFILARVAGHDKDDIVSDLWARVEGLGAVFADDHHQEESPLEPSHPCRR